MTDFPEDQPAEHPGFPVESEPAARPDPETEPGGGEPDYDSEPDRGVFLEPEPAEPAVDPTDIPEEVTDWEAPSAFETADGYEAAEDDDAVAEELADLETVDEAALPDDSAVAEEVHDVEVADEERGHPLVEETMRRLDDLRDRPVAGHAEVYADLQERLQSALADADRSDAADRA